MPVLSRFEAFPTEVLEEITFLLAKTTFLGPPANVLVVLLLSKRIYRAIALKFNSSLYARIFLLKFDASAPVRRLGTECGYAVSLAQELVRRCTGLKRIKDSMYTREVDILDNEDSLLRVDLWMAYLMFTESDGKNAEQLLKYAMVDKLVSKLIGIGGTFHDGMEGNDGWIVDNEINALTAWLFWFTDKERIHSETEIERQNVLEAFAPVFIGSSKYASTYAPITSFLIPPPTPPPLPAFTHYFPLAASPISPTCIIPEHFGLEMTLARPLLTPAALLICVVRLEAAGSKINIPLQPGVLATTAEAITMGLEGPTMEDYFEQQAPVTRCMDWILSGSEMHEHDWMRLRTCYEPWSHPGWRDRVYTPGMLSGVWVGRWFREPGNNLEPMATLHEALHSDPPHGLPIPMQFRLREHHQHERNDIFDFEDISGDGTGAGVLNAWFPQETTMEEIGSELQVYVPDSIGPSTYRTYNTPAAAVQAVPDDVSRAYEHEGLYGHGVWDVILTAETNEDFGRAWGNKQYRGRVRDWDGLIVLVREATDDEDQWIFRGYVHGKQNLVGRWRETRTPVDSVGWEGVWSMTKVET